MILLCNSCKITDLSSNVIRMVTYKRVLLKNKKCTLTLTDAFNCIKHTRCKGIWFKFAFKGVLKVVILSNLVLVGLVSPVIIVVTARAV